MANAKILIVDDDLDLLAALKVTLESENYSVSTAIDTKQGMEIAKAEQPDLIILDVMIVTWQDGFGMARELKKDSQPTKNIPILMLTGVNDKTGIDFKSTAGDPTWCPVDGFLEKPAEPDVLLSEVRKLLSQKS